MIPDNLTMPVTVIAMAVLSLLAGALFRAYQRSQQLKRARIQHLVKGARHAEHLLVDLSGVSLPREVRLALRQDIYDRYRLVGRIHSGYPRVDQLIREAEQRRGSEGGDARQALPVADSAETLTRWVNAIKEIEQIVQHGGLLKPLAVEQRSTLFTALAERHAECLFGFFMNEADKLKTGGRVLAARNRLQHLLELLRAVGARTERIMELIGQAEEAYQYLLTGTVSGAAEGAQQA